MQKSINQEKQQKQKEQEKEQELVKMTLKKIIDRSDRDIPVLNIVMDRAPIATLFYDKNKKSYGLVYHEKFKYYKGLIPFNIDLPLGSTVEIGKLYYSPKLWYPFSARIPSKNRKDCIEKLKEYNLTLNDHPLKILNCIGRISIANTWRLEPCKG